MLSECHCDGDCGDNCACKETMFEKELKNLSNNFLPFCEEASETGRSALIHRFCFIKTPPEGLIIKFIVENAISYPEKGCVVEAKDGSPIDNVPTINLIIGKLFKEISKESQFISLKKALWGKIHELITHKSKV